jgi:hypothetical protein
MRSVAQAAAIVVAGLNLAAGAWGGWLWWRVEIARGPWVAIRVAQAAAAVFAVLAGVLYIAGMRPDDGLFWLYVLLPVPVGVVAEQLRLLAAQTVLEARGLSSSAELGARPDAEQQSVVTQILRRELGVVSLACLVACFLALRAYGTL